MARPRCDRFRAAAFFCAALALLSGGGGVRAQSSDCAFAETLFTQSNVPLPWATGQCCGWSGTGVASISCFGGKITTLWLQNMGLTGPIPAVSSLTAVFQFDLSGNKLSGTLPDFSGLTTIASLDLAGNSLTGTIPATLAGARSLSSLDLSNNLFTAIEDLSGLSQLRTIDLSGNNIATNLDGKLPKSVIICTLSRGGTTLHACTGNIPTSCNALPTTGADCGTAASATGAGSGTPAASAPSTNPAASPTTAGSPTAGTTNAGSPAAGTPNAGTPSVSSPPAAKSTGTGTGSLNGNASPPSPPSASDPGGPPIGLIVGVVVGFIVVAAAMFTALHYYYKPYRKAMLNYFNAGAANNNYQVMPPPNTAASFQSASGTTSMSRSGPGSGSSSNSHPMTYANTSNAGAGGAPVSMAPYPVHSNNVTSPPPALQSTRIVGNANPIYIPGSTGQIRQAHWFFSYLASSSGLDGAENLKYPGAEPLVTVEDFHPRSDDEIGLQVNDYVRLETLFRDGWATAENLSTGDFGLIPIDALDVPRPAVATTPSQHWMESRRFESAAPAVVSNIRSIRRMHG
ncbi:hypothetical protein M427DRAFT_62880 [Gonapodya prolifera JEL478]|uniref:SH3 domain-containing protein n=1 Tax=Gonapodya prolifera (strain JEL478) TaxID=1344416 RepID=A0A139A094_GONPJ|nr:hypothetical protein M427DRAFT_62880 [Gonapodya prolifera JEL478]|eukprot:KXS10144.1 hypothetical protein M427DRAFT_62880 [Gonapodya prolifera JEL478]